MNLTDKVAIVTGSSRGIGQAVAVRLAEAGVKVVLNGTVENRINAVADQIKSTGGIALPVPADVSNVADVNRLIDTVKNAYGKVDILVNNAGIARDQLLLRMSDEEWDTVLNIDLKGVFLCTRAVLKQMLRQRWGRIINISSIVGVVGNPGQANYAAAKAGVIGFTRTVAQEMGSRGITANAVAPGFIETEMTSNLVEAAKTEIKKRIPAGYFGTPRDVAEVVAFLASEEARYVNGQVINIDGGMGGL
jgi:3-oxoacyl-[acyl-carrier protein] reductase